MKRRQPRLACVLALGLTLVLGSWGRQPAYAADRTPGTWTGGAAVGFLANTPDGTAFALNLNGEVFVHRNLSVGPLVQLAFTGNLTQIGLSGQAKYWIDLADRLKLTLRGGLGFVHADFPHGDTSFRVPAGMGLDYAWSRRVNLTPTFLLNFTDLEPGFGTHPSVMPGLTFGVRF